MIRMLADVGNSRLKWAKLRPTSAGWDDLALSTTDTNQWSTIRERWGLDAEPSEWAISSVAPATTTNLLRSLEAWGVVDFKVFQSGQDVPIRNEIEHPETSGADRALGVLGALQLPETAGVPGFIVSCGSAITVDRISSEGIWTGGAIAPGLSLASDTLHARTAQLPRVHVTRVPPPWGRSTVPALEAGVFWGCVGTIRELIARQSEAYTRSPWIIWTGGDAPLLSNAAAFPASRLVHGLVMLGLKAAMGW